MEKAGIGVEEDFRWRGGDVSRIEGLSDAVFAFSVTLLVVSLEVPRTFNDLITAMQGFVAFTLTFALLLWVWYNHYLFFRRYGLQDKLTIVLNAVLLFVVLFYIYPLKFLATLVVDSIFGRKLVVTGPRGEMIPTIELSQTGTLMMVYGAGFMLVFLCFALLYLHAYRKATDLDLNEVEQFDTVTEIRSHSIIAGIGLISFIMALLVGSGNQVLSSLPYWFIGPAMWIHGRLRGKKRNRPVLHQNGGHRQKNHEDFKEG